MKKYALITIEGTACSETGICHICKQLHGTKHISTPIDVAKRVFVDCSGNPEISCSICGKK